MRLGKTEEPFARIPAKGSSISPPIRLGGSAFDEYDQLPARGRPQFSPVTRKMMRWATDTAWSAKRS